MCRVLKSWVQVPWNHRTAAGNSRGKNKKTACLVLESARGVRQEGFLPSVLSRFQTETLHGCENYIPIVAPPCTISCTYGEAKMRKYFLSPHILPQCVKMTCGRRQEAFPPAMGLFYFQGFLLLIFNSHFPQLLCGCGLPRPNSLEPACLVWSFEIWVLSLLVSEPSERN